MSASARSAAMWGLAVLLVAAVLIGQASADALLPPAQRGDTGRLVGRSGFAYLTGIRTYVAAVLWARLEPVDDRFYSNLALGKKRFLVPSIRLVTWLDPAFEEPFYAGPFILYEAGQKRNAIELAAEGVKANPQSALLHGSFAQLLLTDNRLKEARREADLAYSLPWRSEGDKLNLFATVATVFARTGSPEKAAEAEAERTRLKVKFGLIPQQPGAGD